MIYRIEARIGTEWVQVFGDDVPDGLIDSCDLVQSSNSIGTLTLKIPDTNDVYESVTHNTLFRVYNSVLNLWEFFGRVIDETPTMESGGVYYKEFICESAEGFLKDTVVQLDASKSWWNNSSYVEIDEDGTRTLAAYELVNHVISQHNATVGDSWKQVSIGSFDVDLDNLSKNPVSVSADWESTTFDIIQSVAEDCDCEWMVTYGGSGCSIQMHSKFFTNTSGTFEVGDNIASSALEESMADVATRTFPYGETYTKLNNTVCRATEVSRVLKGTELLKNKGTMCRFYVEDALKVELVVGKRDNDYAMVFFTEDKADSLADKDGKISVLKKYQTKKDTGTNLKKHYPVPDKAKYVYVFGSVASGTKCTKYEYYTVNNSDSEPTIIKNDYKVGLKFWMNMLDAEFVQTWLNRYGLSMWSGYDDEGDELVYLAKNEDKYGSIECAEVKDNLLAVKKITDSKKAVYSLSDLVKKSDGTYKASAIRKAKRFFKWACKQAAANANTTLSLKIAAYDLKAAGLDYNMVRLHQNWRVTNSLCGLDAVSEIVRLKRNILKPWSVDIELGDKITKASGAGSKGGKKLDESAAPTMSGNDGDDSVDSAATAAEEAAAIAAAESAEAHAQTAIDKANTAKMYADESTALSKEAYDKVYPITSEMRELLEEGFDEADIETAISTEMSYHYENAGDLAAAKADYASKETRSASKWSSLFMATEDAWASDDEDVQASIAAAKATYADAEAAYYTALGNEIEAETEYACSLTDLAAARAIYAKKTGTGSTATESEIAAAAELVSKAEKAIYGEGGTAANPTEGGSLYAVNQAKAALATAKSELDTAENGIHNCYTSLIEQTAEGITLTATKTSEIEGDVSSLKTDVAQLKVDSQGFTAAIATVDGKADAASSSASSALAAANSAASDARTADANASSAVATANSASSAANSATTAASNAAKTASDYLTYSSGGLSIGYSSLGYARTNISTSGMTIYNSSNTAVASFTSSNITLGGSSSSIQLGGSSSIVTFGGGATNALLSITSITQDGLNFVGITTTKDYMLIGKNANGPQLAMRSGAFDFNCDLKVTGKFYCPGIDSTSSAALNMHWNTSDYRVVKTSASSRRYKTDIRPLEDDEIAAEKLYGLDVIQFVYNEGYLEEGDQREGVAVPGFIAEDVAEAYPIAADIDSNGGWEDWNIRFIIPPMLKLIQDQKRQIDALTERLDALES